ncbi:MAG: four helix bundle protein [Candidatus Buchananbacteria bacterium RBG_13_36_9]|uniref:Four helix bundle protein n=1 Tax=Candidatus Buchananbacteria bacterium RBG_13_36_9 TaxID=1797530 RepID=A0A1G1XQ00_9BACT|nr:MAG: four helix bundle protein [Candidatus Buchananbacteria bacterium RBG_13_36_9]
MPETKTNYDLGERTRKFSEEIIFFAQKIPKTVINLPLISQLIKSTTSIGANYCEANGASSKKDFKNKIYICKKEAKETKYWLELIEKACPELRDECKKYQQEVHELILIFSKIILTLEGKNKS